MFSAQIWATFSARLKEKKERELFDTWAALTKKAPTHAYVQGCWISDWAT